MGLFGRSRSKRWLNGRRRRPGLRILDNQAKESGNQRSRAFVMHAYSERTAPAEVLDAIEADGGWLGADLQLCYLPTLAILRRRIRTSDTPRHTEQFLGFGDPNLQDASEAGYGAVPGNQRASASARDRVRERPARKRDPRPGRNRAAGARTQRNRTPRRSPDRLLRDARHVSYRKGRPPRRARFDPVGP